jgi:hypothetical protein
MSSAQLPVEGPELVTPPGDYTPVPSREQCEEMKKRLKRSIKWELLPRSWEEMNRLPKADQKVAAQIFSIAVNWEEFDRTDFIQGVIMEYDELLNDGWHMNCPQCHLPFDICNKIF